MPPNLLLKIHQLLTTHDCVFDLGTDALLREMGNLMTASAFFVVLKKVNFDSPELQENLRILINALCLGDPKIRIDPDYIIGLMGDDEDYESEELQQAWEEHEEESKKHLCKYYLRLVFSSSEAAYYLFHSQAFWLEKPYVMGAARKRENEGHHVMVELSHPRHLQDLLTSINECPHLSRIEESTEDNFNAAP